MKTVIKTAAATTPVSIAEAKDHLRVTTSDDEAYILTLINAATGHVEQITGRKLINQTWYGYLDAFPGSSVLTLPFGNTSSVTSIKYTDQDGDESTFSSDDYIVVTSSIPGRCVLAYEASWPGDTLYNVDPVVVEFVTGYGAAATDVPDDLRHAIKFLVSHWYENRETNITGIIISEIKDTFASLVSQHRMYDWCL